MNKCLCVSVCALLSRSFWIIYSLTVFPPSLQPLQEDKHIFFPAACAHFCKSVDFSSSIWKKKNLAVVSGEEMLYLTFSEGNFFTDCASFCRFIFDSHCTRFTDSSPWAHFVLISVPFQEKLTYFPVCVSNKKKSEDETEEGLGSLPRNISSVSSLLLFNTTENL